MKKTIFKGAGVAIITPMNEDGSINFDKLGELIEFNIENHTDAIIICGTTGESATMTDKEHQDCITYAIKKTAGRIPVIAGTGSNDTKYAVALSKHAEEQGADAQLVVTPYYNKCSQEGLIKHKNIAAIKEASGDISRVAQIRAACGDDLDVYSGNDDQIIPILSLGGKGVISVLSNCMPRETHDICELCFENKYDKASELALKLLEFTNGLFIDVNPIPVKEALNIMGFEVGECRLPLCKMPQSKIDKLTAQMQKIGLIK